MSRSVSVPSNAMQVAYTSIEHDEDDDDGYAWRDFIANLKFEARAVVPSLEDYDVWVGREDHGILCNQRVILGVSEYCGLVAVWLVPDKNYEPEEADALAQALEMERVDLAKIVEAANGMVLRHVATFSNGEAVYERSQP